MILNDVGVFRDPRSTIAEEPIRLFPIVSGLFVLMRVAPLFEEEERPQPDLPAIKDFSARRLYV